MLSSRTGKQLPGARPRVRRGFSILEMLIVVTILAILAGIVLPHFTKTSVSAKANSILADLQVVRQQLEVYYVEHHSRYPLLIEMWGNLTGSTDAFGNPGADFGPYLISEPVNYFTGGSACAADNSAAWQYDENTGNIRAVVPANVIAELNLSPSDVVPAP